MRIISGTAKRRTLFGPKSKDIRPVLDQVKESTFNILGSVENFLVLDLFSGTGSMGLEAISRGAEWAVFVDSGLEALKLVAKNREKCGFETKSSIVRGEIPKILSKIKAKRPFDLVFVDPPYDQNLVNVTLSELAMYKLIDPESILIIEHSPREKVEASEFQIIDERIYGQTRMTWVKLKK